MVSASKRHKTRAPDAQKAVALVGILFLCGAAAQACQLPVYRWALSNWPADPYEALVFHRGPLSEQQRARVASLESASSEQQNAVANLQVRLANLDDPASAALQALWDAHPGKQLPWLALRYPHAPPERPPAWAGPLDQADATAMIDSPVRRQVVKRLLAGDAAVWVLLEAGNRQKDAAAFAALEKQLKTMHGIIDEARSLTGLIGDGQAKPEEAVSFSIFRVSRTDPDERFFTAMLLGSEFDLATYDEPMAFPVFGRGRALYALVGKGINPDTIRDACLFTGMACTCLVKDQNPGTDLLMTADWEAASASMAAASGPTAAPPPIPPTPFDTEDTAPAPNPALVAFLALALAFLATLGGTVLLARRKRHP